MLKMSAVNPLHNSLKPTLVQQHEISTYLNNDSSKSDNKNMTNVFWMLAGMILPLSFFIILFMFGHSAEEPSWKEAFLDESYIEIIKANYNSFVNSVVNFFNTLITIN